MIVDVAIVAAKAFLVLVHGAQSGRRSRLDRAQGQRADSGPHRRQPGIDFRLSPVWGLVNTLIADPLKFLTKEDFIPPTGDQFLHTLAPCMALFPALVTFAVIPFGDVLDDWRTDDQSAGGQLNIGILYVFAMGSLGVYGIVIGAWASNNKFSLLGGVRGSAQMISYEIAMGLSVMGVLMVYGTLELQEIARGQGALIRDLLPSWLGFLSPIIGWLPAWGIFLQPLAFLFFSPPRWPKPNGFRSICRKASRSWSPAIMSNIPAASF